MNKLVVDENLIHEFNTLLDAPAPPGRQKEQVIQEYLEEHTELIPTQNLLNHHLHLETIVSKFPLGTELTTDYLYITKSSDTWRITLVEIESPDKSIFTNDTKKVTTTAEFNAALNQVRSWKYFIEDNKAEVIRRLEPLLQPSSMRNNPIEFHYQLIIGRSKEKNLSVERKKHFRMIGLETEFDLLTYDKVVSWYENGQPYKKLVLRLTGNQYAFKYMHFEPNHLLAYLGPDRLELTREETDRLKKAGYEVDKWREGDLLIINGKCTNWPSLNRRLL
ncbi:MAG: DUF4263 domain-containing protein [Blastocatellia bacterium]|nr:DUF4263 domain-containing protein [Blastocatellia bacterium]